MKNLYLHIADICDHNCIHCYNNSRRFIPKLMNLNTVNKVLDIFNTYDQITITGGEAILHPLFNDIIELISIRCPHMKIRIDTNGYNVIDIIANRKYISEVRVSLDGSSAEIHDYIRGKTGSFDRCTYNVKRLLNYNIKCEITSTISQYNYNDVENIIRFCENNLNVKKINFHIVTTYGYINDDKKIGITPKQWLNLVSTFNNLNKNIKITYPVGYSTNNTNFKCYIQELDRVSIFPDGKIYPCALYFGDTCSISLNEISSVNDLNFNKLSCSGECSRLRLLSENDIDDKYVVECIYDKRSI